MKKSEWKFITRTELEHIQELLAELKFEKNKNKKLELLLKQEKENSARFETHLSRIAHFLMVEWDAERFSYYGYFLCDGTT